MATDILTMARRYVARGLSVIPIRADGSKAPCGELLPGGSWKPYQDRLPTDAELIRWFDGRGGVGLAIVGGRVSNNLAVMDFETAEAFESWANAVGVLGLAAVNGDPLAETPRGGRHLYLLTAEPLPTAKLAKTKTGETKIELKAEGGYVLAPGCPAACHSTGNEYRWLRLGWLL